MGTPDLLSTVLLLGLVIQVTQLVSTHHGAPKEVEEEEVEEGRSDHQSQPVTGSGDLLPWEHDVNITRWKGWKQAGHASNPSMAAMLSILDKLTSRLDAMTSQIGRVEELVVNQTQELKVTLTHKLKVILKQGPPVDKTHSYQSDSAGIPSQSILKEKSVGDKGERFVFYSDEAATSRFYGDNSSLYQDFEGWCDTHTVAGYGPPKTHHWIYKSDAHLGAWLKDPLPRDPAERTQIWTQRPVSYGNNYYTFRRYDNYSNFRSDHSVKYRERRWWVDGVGSIIYQGSLLLHYERHLHRYELCSEERHIKFLRTTPYTSGQYMFVRFHAHEHGLWVSYPHHQHFRLVLSRLDPVTLGLTDTVTLQEDMAGVKGVWMVCGVLWVLTPGGSGGNHVARAVYDTRGGGKVLQGERHDVELLYGYFTQMTYNPREKVLFGWDNYHLLTWPVLWRKRP